MKNTLVEAYIDSLMNESTPELPIWNIEKIRAGKKSSWDYIDGCMIKAFLEYYEERADERFLNFAENYVSFRVSENGEIYGFDEAEYNLDSVNGAKNLLTLYRLTGKEKYRLAAGKVYSQVINQPRTKEGNFWHKLIYPNQVWLDGLYMVMPFYVEYANMFLSKDEKEKAYKDIYGQFFSVERFLKDEKSGLYFHAFDSSKEMFWCNKETGTSQNFWLRALGWFSMAMLDSLLLLEDRESESYNHLKSMFTEFLDSVLKFQTQSGMWYQLPAFPNVGKNYPETSGSAILSYCLKKGSAKGLISPDYYDAGEKAFKDICDKYLSKKDGRMSLGGICLVAGLGGKNMRDGSFDYYMSEPIVEDDAKGTAPFILAYLY